MATNQGTGSAVLLGVAIALAAQIPTTIAAIPDTMTRGVIQVFTLLAVVICATLVRPREVATMVVNSLRPPASPQAQGDRVSILPPRPLDLGTAGAFHGFELDEDERPSGLETRTPTVPPPGGSTPTPHDTPKAKAVARAPTDPPKGGSNPPAA